MSSFPDIPLNHLFDGSDLNVYDTKVVNLSAGAPGPDLLKECSAIFQKATEHRMKYELDHNSYLFQYGPAVGSISFRRVLADFLTRKYQDTVIPASLVITSGATQGLHLILSTLLDMRAVVFVDEVTYMIALQSISQFSTMRIVPVPFSMKTGVDLLALEKLIEENKFSCSQDKPFWGVYYTIPTFHNPTGVLFSEETNKKIIQLARKHELLIACDDVYNVLCYDKLSPPKRLFAYDSITDSDYQGNVISNGTFSKILSPGIRLGWMECSPKIVNLFRNSGVLSSGGCTNGYTSGIVQSLIELGLMDKQIDLYFELYKERMLMTIQILQENLNKEVEFEAPTGGYFIWLTFPKSIDCLAFNDFCRQNYKVFAIAGPRFSAQGLFRNCIRLTIAFHTKEVLAGAVKRFCQAYDAFKSKN